MALVFIFGRCASLQVILGNYFHGKNFFVLLIHAELYFTVGSSAKCLLYDVLVDSFDPGIFLRCHSACPSNRVKPLSSLLNLTGDITRIRGCIWYYTLASFLATMAMCHCWVKPAVVWLGVVILLITSEVFASHFSEFGWVIELATVEVSASQMWPFWEPVDHDVLWRFVWQQFPLLLDSGNVFELAISVVRGTTVSVF